MEDHRPFEILLRESLPGNAADALLDVLGDGSSSATVSVRLNPLKVSAVSSCKESHSGFFDSGDLRQVPWCKDAYFLPERPNFTLDPAFHAGAYYVQDSSSMFPALIADKILDALSGADKVSGALLDLCASPGGKSTHLISILQNCSRGLHQEPGAETQAISSGIQDERAAKAPLPLIVCNEAVGKRVPPLTDNIAKWGADNVIVTNASAATIGQAEGFFDVILADVPCSGEGMWRKSAEAVEQWSLKTVQDCAALQRSIISDVWPALRQGGLLIYSTCTYNHLENQDNVQYIAEELGAEFVPVEEGILPSGVVRLPWGYQFVPGLVPGEGQFFAVLRKNTLSKARSSNKGIAASKKFGFQEVSGSLKAVSESGLQEKPAAFYLNSSSNSVYMLPADKNLQSRMIKAAKILTASAPSCVKMFGCRVGEIKAGKIIPDADLALSAALIGAENGRFSVNPGGSGKESTLEFSCAEIDRETALKFLARENITPQPSWPRGYILLRYQSLGLGFVNNLGTRCNSLHPLMRRILKVR